MTHFRAIMRRMWVCWLRLQHVATRCNILPHTETHCNTLQHNMTHYYSTNVGLLAAAAQGLQHVATHCNTLQHTATHWDTLQHTVTQHDALSRYYATDVGLLAAAAQGLQHAAIHCNTMQHTATHCNTLQHTAIHCNTLQHTAAQHNALACCPATVCACAYMNIYTLQLWRGWYVDVCSKLAWPRHVNLYSCTAYCIWSVVLQHTATHCNTLQHTATHYHIQHIAFGVSFHLILQSQSNWSLFNGTWQKRRTEVDHRLSFGIGERTL